MSTQETVGQRLYRLRVERNLSQRELATIANVHLPVGASLTPSGNKHGISYAYISRIEAGTRQPSVRALRALAAGLDVTATYLEYGTDTAHELPEVRALVKKLRKVERERDLWKRKAGRLSALLEKELVRS